MLQFIVLLCPGLFSMEVYDLLCSVQVDHSKLHLLQRYASFTLLDITTAAIIVKVLHHGLPLSISGDLTDAFLNGSFLVGLSLAAVFWGYVASVFSSLIRIHVEIEDIAPSQVSDSERKEPEKNA